MSSLDLSNSYENSEIRIENVPFIHVPKSLEKTEQNRNSKIKSDDFRSKTPQKHSKAKVYEDSPFQAKDNSESLVSFSERFEKNTENWRVSEFENEEKLNEYKKLVNELNSKAQRLESERSSTSNSKFGENYKESILIGKSELAEINYSRLVLEKQVSSLKSKINEKEEEITQLKSKLWEKNRENSSESEENRLTPLKVLDKNSKFLSKPTDKNSHPFNKDISVQESSNLQKQLHESLKINDKLTETLQVLKEKLNQKDQELLKFTRESKKPAPLVHRSSSSFSNFNPIFNHQEFENIKQDLDNYVKKCNDLSQELMKRDLEIEDNIVKIEQLNFLIEKKTKSLTEVEENKNKAKIEYEKIVKAKEKVEKELRKSEKKINEERVYMDAKEKELQSIIKNNNSEISNLKRAYDLISNEKDEILKKNASLENFNQKNQNLKKKIENLKSNESQRREEINSLKENLKVAESESNDLKSKLNMIQAHFQTLEFDYSKSNFSLSESQKKVQDLEKNSSEQEKKISMLSEKNKKTVQKLEKSKSKLQIYKKEKFSKYNELKDIARDFINEKTQVSKLFEQNNELKFHINSLEEIRDKMLEKIESLTQSRNELLSKNKILEDQFMNIRFQSDYDIKKYIDEYEKISNEVSLLKQDIKKKNEEIIMAKAENRKISIEKNEISASVKKSSDQEEFMKKILKTSDEEIQKLSEKLNKLTHENESKETKISLLTSELQVARTQINSLTTDLKQLENTLRVLNLDNYSLQSKIEELDKINSQNVSESEIKDDYYKLLRAYKHLSEEFKSFSQSNVDLKLKKTEKNFENLSRPNEEGKDLIFMNEIEKLQIKLEGAIQEKSSLDRKLEFALKEKQDLQTTIEKLKDEIRLKDFNSVKYENIVKEVMKYKNETLRLESDQNKLKKELEKALHKLQHARHKSHTLSGSIKSKNF